MSTSLCIGDIKKKYIYTCILYNDICAMMRDAYLGEVLTEASYISPAP